MTSKEQGFININELDFLMNEDINYIKLALEKIVNNNIEEIYNEANDMSINPVLINNKNSVEYGEEVLSKSSDLNDDEEDCVDAGASDFYPSKENDLIEQVKEIENCKTQIYLNEDEKYVISDNVLDENTQEEVKHIDSLSMYLKEIGQFNLLDFEQEFELSKTVHNGLLAENKLKSIKNSDGLNLSKEEIKRLEADVEEGIEARNFLIESNLRLVVFIAKKYIGRGLEFQDLVQEGNLGLMKAVNKYDYTKGFRFSTYATFWIKQNITRAIADKGRTIRIPVHLIEIINKLTKVKRELTNELGRTPTLEELSDKLELSSNKIQEIQNYAQDIVSLGAPVGDDEDSTLLDFVNDDKLLNALEYTINEKYKSELDIILGNLKPNEEKVVRMRFGFYDGKEHTLEEVGNKLGVTRERIRQIEAKALHKLRSSPKMKKLMLGL